MWDGSKDFANGIFHEPRFYGQAYNTMLESLLAAIPYKLGVPAHIALPAVTTLLALVPFVILGWLSYFKRENNGGLLILLLPLLLPLNYDLISSMPRGFVTGIALASVSMLFYENPARWKFPLFSFFLVLGFICSTNSILFSLPAFGMYFLENRKNPWYYIGTLIGLTAGYFICFQMDLFYLHNPEYNFHRPPGGFSLDYFKVGIEKTDQFFGDLSPLVWGKGWFTLLVLFLLPVLLWIKDLRKESVIMFGTLLMIFLTLFNLRLHLAGDSIFYSFSRMFLPVPVVLAFGIYLLRINSGMKIIILSAVICFVIKVSILPQRLKSVLDNALVCASTVEKTLKECREIKKFAKANNADLVILHNDRYHIYNYACDCEVEDFPATIYPDYDRRTWILKKEDSTIHENVVVLNGFYDYRNEKWLYPVKGKPGWTVIKGNKLTTGKLIERLGINFRDH